MMLKTRQTTGVTPASSETLLTMLETLPDAFFVLDHTDTILYTNASARAMLGASTEAWRGNSFWHSAPHLVSPALHQAVRHTKQTQALTEVQYVSPVTQSWLHVQLWVTVGGNLTSPQGGRSSSTRGAGCPGRAPLPR